MSSLIMPPTNDMRPTADPVEPGAAECPKPARIDLPSVRRRLQGLRGPAYWRGLEELADSETFRAFLEKEFPRQAAPLGDGVGRRQFIQLMGASLALAGLQGCTRQPTEKIVPYVAAPEGIVPGEPLYFATATTLGGIATGILVESHTGRPTKIEGNPEHPASLGATDAFGQASVLSLYDPDRSQVTTYAGEIRPWASFVGAARTALEAQRDVRGAGFRILTETVTSPTLAYQIRSLLRELPEAKWHQYEPVNRDNVRAGTRQAFGMPLEPQYRFENADVILALDADFLSAEPGRLRYAREFSRRRRPDAEGGMNRLYVVEPMPSVTGSVADHRLALRSSDVETFARALVRALIMHVPGGEFAAHAAWIRALTDDLGRARGRSIVLAGDHQPPDVHALAHALNHLLGNVGRTVVYAQPPEAQVSPQTDSLRELVGDMNAGQVELLLMLGGNPVYDAPADLDFARALDRVGLRIHSSLYEDETSNLCHWHVPANHELESWSDARAYDGTVTILQPLIAPLYEGKTTHEIVGVFSQEPGLSAYDVVRGYWKGQYDGPHFETFWRKALHDGTVPGTSREAEAVRLHPSWDQRGTPAPARAPAPDALEIAFRPDPCVYDGRFVNNGWLQELPRPITKITWDNAALLSAATAENLGVGNGDVVELRSTDRFVRAPVWIVPGHADGAVTVHLGYGRSRTGKVGMGAGFDAYALRTSASPWLARGIEVRKTGDSHALACTEVHHGMEGRPLVRAATLSEYRESPDFVHELEHDPKESLYPDHPYDGYAWGMAVDLSACIGCNACAAACQAENNIPVVGKEQVLAGREMNWIRIDRYFEGGLEDPAIHNQPVLCMHCERAPCEVVCPVSATVHDREGLNVMVYNRCVGTRYCSNNCPYKVRRFNFFLYTDWVTESVKLQRNPDVTVRSRGVMEKCTYCVQRINHRRIQAKKEDRPIRDGEVVPACQQACPAEALVFGDINDPESRIAKLRKEPRHYALLGSLNTKPRTTYLAAVRNPNPELEKLKG